MASKKRIIELINEAIYPFCINENYDKNITFWSQNNDLKTIKKAIEIGKESYLKYKNGKIIEETIPNFLGKLGGIIHNLEMTPIDNKVLHIVNTLAYNFSYYDKGQAREILNKYINELKNIYELSDDNILERLVEEQKTVGNYKSWEEWIDHFEPIITEKKNKIQTINELRDYIVENGINTKFGQITDIKKQIGQGGNSIVCFGNLNGEEVAIKILIKYDSDKRNRFYLEYFNIIKSIQNYNGIIQQYFLDEMIIEDNVYPYIIMKKYKSQLEYNPNIKVDELFRFIFNLLEPLKYIHSLGIIHRDLKPQNILIDDNKKIYIADFGIAYFDPTEFALTGHTVKHDRLANFDFSAPEQRKADYTPCPSTDIYALGQLIQWSVYGETHKGTNRKLLYNKINSPKIKKLDKIVNKCLSNSPDDRYSTIEELEKDIYGVFDIMS